MNEQEITCDIIAEMRNTKYGDEECQVKWCLTPWADRFEAAYKRELDALNEQIADLRQQRDLWSKRAAELVAKCNEQYAKIKQVGDCAKLREVVGDLLYMAERYVKKTPATESVIFDAKTKKEIRTVNYYDVIAKAQAALSASPRNCDRYSHDEALQVWASEKENEHNGCFDEWLYEIAKEGGAK